MTATETAVAEPTTAKPTAEAAECGCVAVGLAQIAERLGVKRKTAVMWHHRGTREALPEPRWTVGKDPAWCWPHQIVPWAQRTRRL